MTELSGKIKRGLAPKLIVRVVLFSVVVSIIGTAVQLYLDYTRALKVIEARLLEIKGSYVPSLEQSLWVDDREMVEVELKGILALPDMQYVSIESEGKVATLGEPKGEKIIERRYPLSYSYKGQSVPLGTLVIATSLEGIYQRLLDRVFVILSTQTVTIFLVSAFLFFLFYYHVVRHLVTMADHMRTVEPDQVEAPLVLKKKGGDRATDELDQLAYSFNEMRGKLQDSFDALQHANADLRRENEERLKIEKALRESESRYSLVVNNIEEVFWIVSKDYSKVNFISPGYKKIWGRSCESLYAEPMSWADAIVEEDKGSVQERVRSIQQAEELPPHIEFPEYRIVRPDGSLSWIQAKGVSVTAGDGEIWIAGVCQDITNRKEAEEKLRQAQKMEAIGTLAGGIAHDFNNILSAILGYSELIRERLPDDSSLKTDIEEVLKAGGRARELIKQILTFSHKSEQQRRPVYLQTITKEALKLLRASIPATIEIVHQIDPDVGMILADPVQVHQIIVNLCANAAQAMEETGGVLSVELAKAYIGPDDDMTLVLGLSPGSYARLTVRDTGCGIDPAVMKRIFEPYFTTKETGKGSGLGLAVVHGIVKSYEGAVDVQSDPGDGTAFDVYFPIIEMEEGSEEEAVAADLPLGSERILFVDDEPPIAKIGKRWLESLGYKVFLKNNSGEALEFFKQNPDQIDLVVTDQNMPHLPGSELAKLMLEIRPDLPIILCTGYSSLISESKAKEIGIREFALKPIAGKELARLVRRALDQGAGD